MRQAWSFHAAAAGTGKTQLVANMAVYLAQQGKQVLVVDADMLSPGLAHLFGLAPKHPFTLNHYLWDEIGIDHVVYDVTRILEDAQNTPVHGAVYLMPASQHPGDIQRTWREGYDLDLLIDGLESLALWSSFDHVLIDTHPGLQQSALVTAARSERLILMATPDKQHRTTLCDVVKAVYRIHEPRIDLVLNKLAEWDTIDLLAPEFCNLRIAATLPFSLSIVKLNGSALMMLDYPNHVWCKRVAELADWLSTNSP